MISEKLTKQCAQNNTLIEMHVPDFSIAKEFYSKLGFSVVWESPANNKDGYLVMQRKHCILCFWPGNETVLDQSYFKRFPKNTKRGYGVEIVIMAENIDNLYKTAKQQINVVEELKMQPWGARDFRVEDPFGFYLRFTEAYNVLVKNDPLQEK